MKKVHAIYESWELRETARCASKEKERRREMHTRVSSHCTAMQTTPSTPRRSPAESKTGGEVESYGGAGEAGLERERRRGRRRRQSGGQRLRALSREDPSQRCVGQLLRTLRASETSASALRPAAFVGGNGTCGSAGACVLRQ